MSAGEREYSSCDPANTTKKRWPAKLAACFPLWASLAAVAIVVAGLLYYPPFLGEIPAGAPQAFFKKSADKVNINTAPLEELTVLPGIGATRAEAIIQYRVQNGAFTSPEELMRVQGIGTGTYDQIKDMVCL